MQLRREATLRRAYQRILGRKPTVLERCLIDRLVKAEAAALDPATSVADFYRLDSIARRAKAEFQAIAAKPACEPVASPLHEYLDTLPDAAP